MKPLDLTLSITRIMRFFDGPWAFVAQSDSGEKFLCNFSTPRCREEKPNQLTKYIATPVTDSDLRDVDLCRVTLCEAFDKPETFCFWATYAGDKLVVAKADPPGYNYQDLPGHIYLTKKVFA